jgi:acyl-CoA synthetase (NDP forming)
MTSLPIIADVRKNRRTALSEFAGKQLLAEFNISVPAGAVVSDLDDVEAALQGMKPPFAAKVMSADILHKSDAGGVRLGLTDVQAVRRAIETMLAQPAIGEASVDGFLVEEMAGAGTEIVVGALRDPQFGPLIMVGLGGIFVEILKDVSFRLCPITKRDAAAMLDDLRSAALLSGARGQTPVNRDAIVDILVKLGGSDGLLMSLGEEWAEIDVNPVIVSAEGAVAVDARIILSAPGPNGKSAPSQRQELGGVPPCEFFAPLFAPKTVAVVGASGSSATIANTFIRRMKDFGFPGQIYPIHPKADEIEDLPAYPSLAQTPEPIDYAYIAIGAVRIPDLLAAAAGRVRFAQVVSSGFAEVSEGKDLEKKLVEMARTGGCRLLGPNCLGLYSPRGGVTFPADAPRQVGSVGIISQSGGLSTDIIKRGQWRGLRLSGLVTIGNSADLGPVDLAEFYFDDPQTKVIGLYLEDIKDGRRFFDLLRSSKATKPVVILRGGRSQQGRAAAASHTGAIAGDGQPWAALARQTGCVIVATVDEFIDVLLALQFLTLRPGRPTKNITLFGNGGGTSVLAADTFSELGLDVSPFPEEARAALEALKLPPGTSVANPIDAPVRTMQEEEGRVASKILDIVYRLAVPDAVVMHLNLAAFVGRGDIDPIDNLIQAALDVQTAYPDQAHFLLALRTDGSPALEDRRRTYRQAALDIGIPVYDEIANVARALAAVRALEERFRARPTA